MMSKPKRGEIWLVRFPFTDLTSTKLRPAVVWAIHGQDIILIGIFSRIPSRSIRKTWVLIEDKNPAFRKTGLKKTSLIRAEKIAVVHQSVFQKKLGKLSSEMTSSIEEALKKALQIK